MSAVLMRNTMPSVTEGARLRCRLALSSKNETRGVSFSVALSPWSRTRRMNLLQVAHFLSGGLV